MDAQLKDRNLQDVRIAELNGELQELRITLGNIKAVKL